MKSKVIKVYADSGHSWAKIDRIDLEHLNILDEISGYSYQKKGSVYLEEDSDLSIYINALKERYPNIDISYNVATSNRSRIRNYPSYRMTQSEIDQRDIKACIRSCIDRLERGFDINASDHEIIAYALRQFLKM